MKKVIIIVAFVSLLLFVLASMENDLEKLLKKKKLTEKDIDVLKQYQTAIEQRIKEALPARETTQHEEIPINDTPKKEENDETTETEVPEKEQTLPQNTTKEEKPETSEAKSIEMKACRKCGVLIPKYPIYEVYCPECKAQIKAQKHTQNKKDAK